MEEIQEIPRGEIVDISGFFELRNRLKIWKMEVAVVEPLWEEKKSYAHFDPAKHSIAEVFGIYNRFIPYYRKYGTLSQS